MTENTAICMICKKEKATNKCISCDFKICSACRKMLIKSQEEELKGVREIKCSKCNVNMIKLSLYQYECPECKKIYNINPPPTCPTCRNIIVTIPIGKKYGR